MVRKYGSVSVVEALTPEQQAELKKLYFVENEHKVFDYLISNPELFDLLIAAVVEIDKYFNNSKKYLEYSIDPEYKDDDCLIIYLSPQEDPDKAVTLEKTFQENWGQESWMKSHKKLLIILEYR
jgi:hypothetical protein